MNRHGPAHRGLAAPWRRIGLVLACALPGGCLMNSVHSIRTAPRAAPDRAHALVVIGVGLDQPWPYTAFPLTFPEYSVEKQRITGNCFVYNRVDVRRPPAPSAVSYLVYEVPANAYLLQSSLQLVDENGAPSPGENGFIAPPGGVVFFGDYVFEGNATLRFRRDLGAARAATSKRLPPRLHLELAELFTATPGARMPLCTP